MWSRVWQMVCREEDIAEPGDHHVYNIIDSSVIVTRTPSGSIKGYINSCLHRGRCLRDESGTVNEFRCPFHGATWNLDGEFQGIPCQWDFEHLADRDMSLPEVKTGTWGGFVFVNFDPSAQPLAEATAHFERDFGFLRMQDLRMGDKLVTELPCNWKLVVENIRPNG